MGDGLPPDLVRLRSTLPIRALVLVVLSECVFELNRSFYPATLSVHAVSVLIINPLERTTCHPVSEDNLQVDSNSVDIFSVIGYVYLFDMFSTAVSAMRE